MRWVLDYEIVSFLNVLVGEGDELDLIGFLPVDSQLGHVPACSEWSEQ